MAKQRLGEGSGLSRVSWMVGAREVLPQESADHGPVVQPVLQAPIPEPWRTHGKSLGGFVSSLVIRLCLF